RRPLPPALPLRSKAAQPRPGWQARASDPAAGRTTRRRGRWCGGPSVADEPVVLVIAPTLPHWTAEQNRKALVGANQVASPRHEHALDFARCPLGPLHGPLVWTSEPRPRANQLRTKRREACPQDLP